MGGSARHFRERDIVSDRTALYRIYDETDALLYIGISKDALRRLAEHLERQPWSGVIARVQVEYLPDRAAAVDAERHAIRTEVPRFNVVHALTKPETDREPTSRHPVLVELIKADPRIGVLAGYTAAIAARAHDVDEPFDRCANRWWYGVLGLRDFVTYLVGWSRTEQPVMPVLRSSRSYDVLYHYCYNLLPDCGGDHWCGVAGPEERRAMGAVADRSFPLMRRIAQRIASGEGRHAAARLAEFDPWHPDHERVMANLQ